ncbi:MAG: carboxypeptidase regulatory-like domain-containing protein [Deltaproteobacteria bacterium]|nr:carboxypeptidase regulatory-like domain-containing protein [Deltaproteobacteria bacterium]
MPISQRNATQRNATQQCQPVLNRKASVLYSLQGIIDKKPKFEFLLILLISLYCTAAHAYTYPDGKCAFECAWSADDCQWNMGGTAVEGICANGQVCCDVGSPARPQCMGTCAKEWNGCPSGISVSDDNCSDIQSVCCDDNATSEPQKGELLISIPKGYGPDNIALGASSYLNVRNNTQILAEAADGYAMVGSTGSVRAEIGNGAQIGDLYTNEHAWLHDNVSVHGDIWSPNDTEFQNIPTITIDGIEKREAVPVNELRWNFDIPDSANSGLFLGAGQTLNAPLPPGRYESLQLHPNSSITLVSGTYVFDAFQIESDANIVLDDSDGAIFIYVIANTNYWMRGNMIPVNGDYARVMLAYTGTMDQFIEKRFVGTIVSPNAKVVVRGTTAPHKGAIFAKNIEIDAGAVLEHVPFGWLISDIVVGPEDPCLGEPTSIWVDTFSGLGDVDIDINISGSNGPFRTMAFYGSDYERDVPVVVTTSNGMSQFRTVTISPKLCDFKVYPVISVTYDPLLEQHNLVVLNAKMFDPASSYHWNFGTGTELYHQLSAVSYNYANYVDHEQLFTTFEIYVDVEQPDGTIYHGATTLKVMSDFAFDKEHNIFRPLVTTEKPNLPMNEDLYFLEYSINNPDKADAVSFTDALFEFVPCDSEQDSTSAETSISTVVAPQSSYSAFLVLDSEDIPEDTCNIVLRFTGYSSDTMPAYGNVTYRFESNSRVQIEVEDEEARAFILDMLEMQNSMGEDAWRISQKQLLEWKMSGVDVPNALLPGTIESAQSIIVSNDTDLFSPESVLPKTTPYPLLPNNVAPPTALAWNVGNIGQLMAAVNMAGTDEVIDFPHNPQDKICNPTTQHKASWGRKEYICSPEPNAWGIFNVTADPQIGIVNGRKGDALMSRACSFVGDMLSVINHQYSHTGIITKHGVEVTHSILEIDRLLDNLNGVGLTGIDSDVLKYGLPGVITQSIEMAYWPFSKSDCDEYNWENCNCAKDHSGEWGQADPFDDCYVSTSFSASDAACSGTDTVKPLVVKPLPEFDDSVRAQLIVAADYAKTIRGHYRFHTYMKGELFNQASANAPYLSEWPSAEDSRASSCGVFVMNALKQGGGFSLENSVVSKPQVEDMAEVLFNGIKSEGMEKYGKLADGGVAFGSTLCSAFGGVAGWVVGGPVGGVIGGIAASDCVAELVERGSEHAARQVSNCFVHDKCSDSLDNRSTDYWKDVESPALTVSPGHIVALEKDGGWPSAAEGGPYGYYERIAFTNKYYSLRHVWQPVDTPVQVTVQVNDECGNPLKNAAVIVVGSGISGVTDDSGWVTFDNVPIGKTYRQDFYRAVEVHVSYNGVQETQVLSSYYNRNYGMEKIDVLIGTVELDLSKHIPEEHKIEFAGIVQIFQDGGGSHGNSKNEKIFHLTKTLLPGKDGSDSMESFCLTDAQAEIKLYCELEEDGDDNPVNNEMVCEITSSIEQGQNCYNLNNKTSGTQTFRLKPGEKEFVMDMHRIDVGMRDDNMRFRGYLLHDFAWHDSYDLPAQSGGTNTFFQIKQGLRVRDGIDWDLTRSTEDNDFLLSWNNRVIDQQISKCVHEEMAGHSIGIAILDVGRYPLDSDGDILWSGVQKGSTNRILGIGMAQGFNDNSCDRDRPFPESYFNLFSPIIAGSTQLIETGNQHDGDDYMFAEFTIENQMPAAVSGPGQCVLP